MERSEIRGRRRVIPGLRGACHRAALRADPLAPSGLRHSASCRLEPRPHSPDAIDQTASLATFNGDALTVLLAGLAANSIGSLVNGLMPLRASVAGLLTTDIFTKPGITNSPDSLSSLYPTVVRCSSTLFTSPFDSWAASEIASTSWVLVILAMKRSFDSLP